MIQDRKLQMLLNKIVMCGMIRKEDVSEKAKFSFKESLIFSRKFLLLKSPGLGCSTFNPGIF
jgi:hypothetical protein